MRQDNQDLICLIIRSAASKLSLFTVQDVHPCILYVFCTPPHVDRYGGSPTRRREKEKEKKKLATLFLSMLDRFLALQPQE